MHGDGRRRVCPACGQSVLSVQNILGHLELRGPRNITSSNIDRIFDDGGRRFLVIEEKRLGELTSRGQAQLLAQLARRPGFDVWFVGGSPRALEIWKVTGDARRHLWLAGDFATYQHAVLGWFERKEVSA